MAGRKAKDSLHTRIILFANPNADDHQLTTLGVVAEKITETTTLSMSDFVDSGIRLKNLPFLGGIFTSQNETVQLVFVDALFEVMKEISVYAGV